MRVGIVTFQHANNYGALLQAYALQRSVKQLNQQCDIITYESGYIEAPYSFSQLKRKGFKAWVVGIIGYVCYLPRKKKCNAFRKNMTYSRKVNRKDVSDLNDEYDIFIAGSDQVWNYKLTGGDMNFLLGFVRDNKKKNSYAASIGLNEIEPYMHDVYIKNLMQFKNISVRERRAKEIISELAGIDCKVVVDPTLLLKAQEWEDVIADTVEKGNYIVVYQLGISKRFTDYVKDLAATKGLKVKYIPFPLGGHVKSQSMLTIGPSEWLGLFKQAQYVVTDSFHGIVFSLVFHKQFMVEVNETNKNVGGRIYDLLQMVNLEKRMLNAKEPDNIDFKIDFEKVDVVLSSQREQSKNYLKMMIEEYNEKRG